MAEGFLEEMLSAVFYGTFYRKKFLPGSDKQLADTKAAAEAPSAEDTAAE